MPVFRTAAADIVCIVLFAVVGRASHAETLDPGGVFRTAWPFLVGGLFGHLVALSWRDPVRLRTGVIVWLGAVIGGMALRLVSGSTAQPAFVVVATITLAVLLVGWRMAFVAARRVRRRRSDRVAV